MTITSGTKLGSYQIASLLGEGGMGRVFRAHDTKLKRDVAIKVLPDEFSRDFDRVARFQREAEVLASLNHQNIAGIYDVVEQEGSRFLVMELVEGETLADRIARGPLPLDESLDIAQQTAEALEAAHERGIVHRDLKPANIKIAPDGKVKVLDFGLAKMWELSPGASAVASHSPTLIGGTTPGVIMGTASYMSPEQARGKTVDRGTDTWAFACVLYEILTGRKTFEGETVTDILGAIVRGEPDWNALPPDVPAHIRRLLRRCLEKDRRRRLRDAGAVLLELRERPDESAPAIVVKSNRERWVWIAAVTVLTASMIAALIVGSLHPRSPANEMRLEINTVAADPVSFAIAPDGLKLVFVSASDGQPKLWLRLLDSVATRTLGGTDGAIYPFWSPDSRSVGFFADGKLKRIDIAGGAATALADAPSPRGGAWNSDGVILFTPTSSGPIFAVTEGGANRKAITKTEPGQSSHRFMQFLPDRIHFLFYVQGTPEARGVYVASLDNPMVQRLTDADAFAGYSMQHIFFVRQETLFAQKFDVNKLSFSGSPFPVAERVAADQSNGAPVSVSAAGLLAYRSNAENDQRQFVWFDRNGKEVGKAGGPDTASPFAGELSPDGRRVVLNRTSNGVNDIWKLELDRGVLQRFTSDTTHHNYPIWSHDGRRILFNSNHKGSFDLYQKPADGTGNEELIFATPNGSAPNDLSPDNRFLLYTTFDSRTGSDIWALSMDDRKPFPVVQTSADEREGQFSPDGKWIAYRSNETARAEIYVQPFPGAGAKTRVSTNGGAQVRWRGDGKELFYIALDGQLMAVPIRLDSSKLTAEVGTPQALFRTRIVGGAVGSIRHQYMVAADGQRFLINSLLQDVLTSPITLVLNWHPKP